ncbi:hypothetical protein [Peribacillus butanolivorans]|uniref:Uncharacterized protein n=1 Tax=Peribacillus butanolivorans TaxID=421767 RepID=A0AAX0S8W5_9BACI|nr:hypothetical protein [Peribacillus butanolivorans]PEJ36840.1 hypothetical protein CN689_03065 [Peribacillus butanolivorans]QNU05892.1 hypothetical protein GM240_19625 [Peribacillus butanolivorans]
MSENKSDKDSKPLLYVNQAKISDQRGNMQSDFRTKKGTHQETVEHESVETEQGEEKIEKIKREFGVFDAMKEIESEITAIKKITDQYVPEQPSVEQTELPVQEEKETAKVVKKKKKKVEKKVEDKVEEKESSSEIITRLSKHQGYPKPLCEAVINGETLKFQVLGMRGESVKIKRGNHIRFVGLPNIIDAKIIEESK